MSDHIDARSKCNERGAVLSVKVIQSAYARYIGRSVHYEAAVICRPLALRCV